jgi:VanZ family protein
MKVFSKYQRPAFLWASLIFILCSVSFGSVGQNSHLFFPGFDKLVHCGLFFVLAVFMCNGSIRQYNAANFTIVSALKVFIVALCYGALIEVLQMFVFTWRSGEWPDLFSDSVGAGMGVFSTLVILYASANAKS